MANIKSAIKRARQNVARREHNRGTRTKVRTYVKKVLSAVAAGQKDEAQTLYREVTSILDRAARKNLIHKNKAARHKSRLNQKIKAMG